MQHATNELAPHFAQLPRLGPFAFSRASCPRAHYYATTILRPIPAPSSMFALVCNCWHYVPLSIAIQCQEQQDPALEGESSAGAAEDGWRAECHPQPSQSRQLLNYFQPATEDCTWNRIHSSLALQKLQIFNFRFLFCAFPARQPTDPSTLPFDLCVWDWYWVLLSPFFPRLFMSKQME